MNTISYYFTVINEVFWDNHYIRLGEYSPISLKQLFLMPYIEAEHERDLREFKYQGTCASISYKYLWSPFAEFLLKFVPETIAPNMITLVAFSIIVMSHFIFMFWGDSSYSRAAEPWKYALFGITLFVYQHLDNLDGKQARRTKNSTAVGMLFDHGCDAISSMLVGLQFLKVIQAQDIEISFYAMIALIMIPNFIVIWTQYGIGSFHLDEINPIDEGLPCYQLMALLGYFIDYSFWQNSHIITSYNYEFLLIFVLVVIFVCGKMAKNVMKDTKRESKDMYSTLVLPVILLIVVGAVRLFGLHQFVYGEHFYTYFYIWVCFWGRNQIHMQICSVANQKFNVFNWSTIFFITSIALPILLPVVRAHLTTYLYVCLAIQFLFMIQLFVSFLRQAASILKIRLFHINPPPQAKAQ